MGSNHLPIGIEKDIYIGIIVVLYLLPSFVARMRRHLSGGSVFYLNLLLGWTLIGWAAALIWAFTGKSFAGQKACVFCKEWIPREAVVCSHCARDQNAGAFKVPDLTVPCRYCKTEISKEDDICYNCKKSQTDPLALNTVDL